MEADPLLQQLRDLPTANSAAMLSIHRQMSLAAPLTLAGVLLNLLPTRDPTVPVRATQLSLLTKLPSLQSKNNSPNRRRMQLSLKRTMKIPKVQTQVVTVHDTIKEDVHSKKPWRWWKTPPAQDSSNSKNNSQRRRWGKPQNTFDLTWETTHLEINKNKFK